MFQLFHTGAYLTRARTACTAAPFVFCALLAYGETLCATSFVGHAYKVSKNLRRPALAAALLLSYMRLVVLALPVACVAQWLGASQFLSGPGSKFLSAPGSNPSAGLIFCVFLPCSTIHALLFLSCLVVLCYRFIRINLPTHIIMPL